VKLRDYYEDLGVPRTASADEIKRAYRQLARKHHPDLATASEKAEASERFKEINEAYEVLSDTEKRAKYDALGPNWKAGAEFTPSGAGAAAPGPTAAWRDVGDFSDFFESIFGGMGGGRRERRPGGGVRFSMAGADVEAELPITIEEAMTGGRRRLTMPNGRSVEAEIPVGIRDGSVLRIPGQGEPGIGGGPPGDL
jgi:curved DNA-binding protein